MKASIYLERGARRTFARAVDWPGWCRVARDAETARAPLGPRRRVLAGVRRGGRRGTGRAAQEPRGGGRGRDEIVTHVAESERSYARSIGVRYTPTQFGHTGGQAAMRAGLIDVLRGARDGTPPGGRGWPPRYAARRIAWHVLDHAWEIHDRSD